tara:strand:+ start:47 stop:871 length:825 start_codon:yes stop_codon:yes gene_type:complete
MSDLQQNLLTKLFRKFFTQISEDTFASSKIRTITLDNIYKSVEKYMKIGYTENDLDIIEFYNIHYLQPSSDKKIKQRILDKTFMLRNEQKKKNLKFIEENELVEHPRYKGFYGAKDSRVFSNRGRHGAIRELKPVLNKSNNGYYMMCCGRDENGKTYQVSWHRFIAEIFIPNLNNLPEVNHIDEDKGNCCVENLEWSDRLNNIRHSADNWGSDYIVENIITGEISEIKNLSKWCEDNQINYGSIRSSLKSKNKLYKNKFVFTRIEGTKKRGLKL